MAGREPPSPSHCIPYRPSRGRPVFKPVTQCAALLTHSETPRWNLARPCGCSSPPTRCPRHEIARPREDGRRGINPPPSPPWTPYIPSNSVIGLRGHLQLPHKQTPGPHCLSLAGAVHAQPGPSHGIPYRPSRDGRFQTCPSSDAPFPHSRCPLEGGNPSFILAPHRPNASLPLRGAGTPSPHSVTPVRTPLPPSGASHYLKEQTTGAYSPSLVGAVREPPFPH